MTDRTNTLSYLLTGSRTALVVIAALWLGFALLSGATEAGGGLKGLIANSPNALPWAALLLFAGLSFRWPIAGGTLCALAGAATIIGFHTYKAALTLALISAPLVVFGAAVAICGYLIGRRP